MSEITDEMVEAARSVICGEYSDCTPRRLGDVVAASTMRKALQAALSTQPPKSIDRDSVLEEAAKVAETAGNPHASEDHTSIAAARRIRALKDTP